MFKIILITILIGYCAAECNNFCTIVNENYKKHVYVVRDFTIGPVIRRNLYDAKINMTEGVHIKCLEMKPIACSEKVFCLGCCNVSENKTYRGYRTKIENLFSCDRNECCRDTDLLYNPTEMGCEVFVDSD